MNRISAALLVSLLAVAGVASAQTSSDGIVMTHDSNVAASIEQHAREIQAQPADHHEADAADEKAGQKPAAHHRGHQKVAKSKEAQTPVASN